MKIRLLADIAISLLLARFKQTLVAAIGVTFSITMFISLLGFMEGLNTLLDNLVLNRTPHIRLYNELQPSLYQPIQLTSKYINYYHFIQSIKPKNERLELYNSQAIMQALRSDHRVLGIAPKTTVPVFYNVGAINLNGIINGIDVEAENQLFNFQDYVAEGNSLDLKNTPNSIMMGSSLAKKMLTHPGDIIQLTTTQGDQFPLKVVGFFQSGIDELDKVQSYVSLATSQKLMGKPNNYITDIQIKLHDLNRAPDLAKEYKQLFNVDALDIQTANAQFETGSSVRTIISYAVGITLLIVAGFGIYNILNMMIYEKMDSIAILKATGFSGKDVNRIFITIALTTGIVGGLAGLIGGFGLSAIIDQIPFHTSSLPKVTTYPVDYSPGFYVIGAVFSLITTYLAGYFPAKKASRVDPVNIIRGR